MKNRVELSEVCVYAYRYPDWSVHVAKFLVESKHDEWYHIDAIENPLEEADELDQTAHVHEDHEQRRNGRLRYQIQRFFK